jgi:hypothetical protein
MITATAAMETMRLPKDTLVDNPQAQNLDVESLDDCVEAFLFMLERIPSVVEQRIPSGVEGR